MRIIGSFGLSSLRSMAIAKPGASLLPGGKAGLEAQGFAISAGTQHPDAAYALVKYLSFKPGCREQLSSVRLRPPEFEGRGSAGENDQQQTIAAFRAAFTRDASRY